jgi:hypothetical protein
MTAFMNHACEPNTIVAATGGLSISSEAASPDETPELLEYEVYAARSLG